MHQMKEQLKTIFCRHLRACARNVFLPFVRKRLVAKMATSTHSFCVLQFEKTESINNSDDDYL